MRDQRRRQPCSLHLEARLQQDINGFNLDVRLDLPTHGVIGLFGHHGAGKSTLLRCLAGRQRLDNAYVAFAGEVWQDSRDGRFVPSWQRPVGFVSARPALPPAPTVGDLLQFGAQLLPEAQRATGAGEVIDWLQLSGLLRRPLRELATGEQQRVSLAHALLGQPRLLLLDEPLAGLAGRERREALAYLEALAERLPLPFVFVSHAIDEVMRLCDRVVWLERGRVRAADAGDELRRSIELALRGCVPADAVLHGRVHSHLDDGGLTRIDVSGGALFVPREDLASGEAVDLRLPLQSLHVQAPGGDEGQHVNTLAGTVREIRDAGPLDAAVRVRLGSETPATELTCLVPARQLRALGLVPGDAVRVEVHQVELLPLRAPA